MDFSGRQQEPGKKFIGLGLVVVLHIILGWALLNGLGNKLVKFIQKPMEAVVKPVETPPPPDEPPPPPPKLVTPPPPFIPPPEVQVQQQAPTTNTISAVSNVAPPTNVITKAPAPVVAEAPKAPAGPSYVAARIDFQQAGCKPEYPRASQRNEETGDTELSVTTGADGLVTNVQITKSSGFRALDSAVRAKLMAGECRNKPGTIDGKPQETVTKVVYTWRLD
ncbi:MAG: TonB family protein [Undibacterium sp.]|nr:TonB family protein [Undibacterium sp.]